MTSPQIAKLNMYDAVIHFCETNPEIIDSMPALSAAFQAFKDAADEIEAINVQESLPINGIAINKSETRKALAHQAFTIANALFAYAVISESNELKEQVNLSQTQLLRFKHEELPVICLNLATIATGYHEVLQGYNITPDTILQFRQLIERNKSEMSRPRNAVTKRSSQLAMVKTLFRKADSILRNQMDKIITRFILSNPSFYTNYAGNRALIDPNSTPTQIKGTIIDSTDKTPISSVQIRVLENETVVTTGGRGRYMIKPLKPGVYSLKVTKEGFKEQTITGLLVKLGQITTFDAALFKAVNG